MASQLTHNLQPNMFGPAFSYPAELLDNLSWQMLASQMPRRPSWGSSSSRGAGSPTRVTKPSSSASNSPSPAVSRRTTLAADNTLTRRRQQTKGSVSIPMPASTSPLDTFYDCPQRATTGRPLSWHPGSFPQVMQYQQQQQQQEAQQQAQIQQSSQYCQFSQYSFPALQPSSQDAFGPCGPLPSYSPTPTTLSSNGCSPLAFSPMVLPSSGFDASYLDIGAWNMAQQAMPAYLSAPSSNCPAFPEPLPFMANYAADGTPLLDGFDWSAFAMPAAFPTEAPPTPEVLPLEQQLRPSMLPAPEEDEGEILVGMGLYDESDKLIDDPQLDHSRSSMSMLMGSMPTGKGLKLEETWQPPENEDDDEEE